MSRMSHRLIALVVPFFVLFLAGNAHASDWVLPWGGEWPFPLVVETVNGSDLSGIWEVEGRGLVLEIFPSQENNKLISIVARSSQNRQWVALGIAYLEEGVFHGWIRYNRGNKSPEHEIVIGRGRHEPMGADFYYLIERVVGGDRHFQVERLWRVAR